MFEGGILEKLVQECTGHCSVEALYSYRTFKTQQKAVSSLLTSSKAANFSELVKFAETGEMSVVPNVALKSNAAVCPSSSPYQPPLVPQTFAYFPWVAKLYTKVYLWQIKFITVHYGVTSVQFWNNILFLPVQLALGTVGALIMHPF